MDRTKYLRKILFNKIAIIVTQVLIIVAIIALWEILANYGIIDSFITSQPSRIVETFFNLSSNNLLEHIGVTCLETLIGFVCGAFLGYVIAIVLWWSKFLAKVAEPFLVVLNSLPKIALGPVIIIWVGAGMPAIIVMALSIATVVCLQQMMKLPQRYEKYAKIKNY